jgi:DNA polymerase-3 subunit alpha (Gram-positive type)
MKTFTAIDIETTGLDPVKDTIIEIGAARYIDGILVDTFVALINPRIRLPRRITEITGITDDMLAGQRTFEDVLPEFLDYIKDDVLIGHNVKFDFSFLKVHAARLKRPFEHRVIDTLYLAKKLHGDLASRSLGAMCEHYHIVNEQAHRAYEDAKTCAELYLQMHDRFYSTNEDIFKDNPIYYKVKKEESITAKQKMYLNDMLKYHKINLEMPIEELTKSEASRLIDKIILKYGRMTTRYT